VKEISRDFKVEKPDNCEWIVYSCNIAGTSFYQNNALSFVKNPTGIILKFEPDNKHDPNTIAVFSLSGKQLGHIPKEIASTVPRNIKLSALVRRVYASDEGYTSIEIGIFEQPYNSKVKNKNSSSVGTFFKMILFVIIIMWIIVFVFMVGILDLVGIKNGIETTDVSGVPDPYEKSPLYLLILE